MKGRIVGIDMARALAVFGMIFVNFKLVIGQEGSGWLKSIAGIFEGKAAATFVVLAGTGLALLSKSALVSNDERMIRKARTRIAKRAIFLFVVGLSYISIWPADILHFYGVYMLFVIIFLRSEGNLALIAALILILLYPVLMIVLNYETGWDFETMEYSDFWTPDGFLRNLFYNGFHPAIPWASFMLVGFWFGKQDTGNPKFVYKSLRYSVIIFAGIQLISILLLNILSGGDSGIFEELKPVLGTSPMPPLPIYMISGSSIAIAVISLCILTGFKFPESKIVYALNQTGQLALTFYVAHVIIGIGGIELAGTKEPGSYSIEFSMIYSGLFSLGCLFFALLWKKYKTEGPLERVMRKFTN